MLCSLPSIEMLWDLATFPCFSHIWYYIVSATCSHSLGLGLGVSQLPNSSSSCLSNLELIYSLIAVIVNRLWALVTSTTTTSELWMLYPPPKTFSIPLEVYTSYLHVILHHPTKFCKIPSKIALLSTLFSSQSLSAASVTYPYTDPPIAQPSLIRSTWFIYHSTQGFFSFRWYLARCDLTTRWGRLRRSESPLFPSLLGTLLSSSSHIFVVSHRILSITSSFDSSTIPLSNRVTRIPLPSLVPPQQCQNQPHNLDSSPYLPPTTLSGLGRWGHGWWSWGFGCWSRE